MASIVLITLQEINFPILEPLTNFEVSLTVGNKSASFFKRNQKLTFLLNSVGTNLKLNLIHEGSLKAHTQMNFSNIFIQSKKVQECLLLTPNFHPYSGEPPSVSLQIELQSQLPNIDNQNSPQLRIILDSLKREIASPTKTVVAELPTSQDPFVEYFQNLREKIDNKMKQDQPQLEQLSKLKVLLQNATAAREELHSLMQDSSESINQKVESLNQKIKNLISENSRLQGEVIQEQLKLSTTSYENHSLKRNLADQGKELEDAKQKIQVSIDNEKALRASFIPSGMAEALQHEQSIAEFQQQYQDFVEILNNLQDDKQTLENTILNVKEELVDTQCQMNGLNTNLQIEKAERKRLESELNLVLLRVRQAQEKSQAKIMFAKTAKENSQFELDLKKKEFSHLQAEFQKFKQEQLVKQTEMDSQINQFRLINSNLQIGLKSTKSALQKTTTDFQLTQIRSQEENAQIKTNFDLHIAKLTQDLNMSQQQSKLHTQQAQANILKLQNQYTQLHTAHTQVIKELSLKKAKIQGLFRDKQESQNQLKLFNQELQVVKDLKAVNQILRNQSQIFKTQNQSLRNDLLDIQNLLSIQSKQNQESNQKVHGLNVELFETRMDLQKLKSIVAHWKTSAPRYVPVKNDTVDQALADYLNDREEALQVPFVRQDAGIYMFGFKKVFVKIQNGQVIIRVGGGYMLIDEFLELYTPMEIEKIKSKDSRLNEIAKSMIYGKYSSAMDANQVISQELSTGQFATMYTERKSLISPTKLMQPTENVKRRNTLGNFARK